MLFEPNEMSDVMVARKTGGDFFSVLINSSQKVGRHPNVKRSVFAAR